MNIDTIKEYVDKLIEESPLKDYPEVFISNSVYMGHLVTDFSSKRYDLEIFVEHDQRIASSRNDHLLDKRLEKPFESFKTLEVLKAQWHEFEKLLLDEGKLPVNYVKYPNMRGWIVESLEFLTNVEYQKRVWVDRNLPENEEYYYDFTDVVHALFDDTNINENPTEAVGYTLRNEEEAKAIVKVTDLIDKLLNRLGNNEPESTYLNDPDWAHVVKYAQEALRVFKS